jgi:hypothetical protein
VATFDVEQWSRARLIPAAGIRGAKEQEERSTSALLAVMAAVPAFGKAVLKHVGAPSGRISTFVEPHLEAQAGGVVIPDGVVVVEWGRSRWLCLVEVKTGDSVLDADQVDRYLAVASQMGVPAVLTISNQIVARPDEPPVAVDKRKTRKLRLRHLSWFRILTEAVIQHQHKGVADPDQAWVLSELIEYLDDPRSGASGFDDMGPSWVTVRNAARDRTLRPTDPGVREVAESWESFIEYLALRLHQRLGRPVTPAYARGCQRADRVSGYTHSLGHQGRLTAVLQVPDAAPIELEADLAAQQVTTRARLQAPKEGAHPLTRINWLLRQLRSPHIPADLRVEVDFGRKHTTALPIGEARAHPRGLLSPDDPKRQPREFAVAVTRDMGLGRGKTKGSFVAATADQATAFYGDVVQKLKLWTPSPPQLKGEPPQPETPPEKTKAATGESPPIPTGTAP